jgi:hypothetical protein
MEEVNPDVPQAESSTTTRNENGPNRMENASSWGATGSTQARHADEIVEA